MVGEVGFEPTMFTLWERVYSPLLDHRPSSSPGFDQPAEVPVSAPVPVSVPVSEPVSCGSVAVSPVSAVSAVSAVSPVSDPVSTPLSAVSPAVSSTAVSSFSSSLLQAPLVVEWPHQLDSNQ